MVDINMEVRFVDNDFVRSYRKYASAAEVEGISESFSKDVFKRFSKNKGAVIGCVAIIIIITMAIFGPSINAHTYKSIIIEHSSLPPRIPVLENMGVGDGVINGRDVYEEKNFQNLYYLFGTDTLGRDLWTRTWVGTRISLYIAGLAMFIDMIIGMGYGLISGFFGGKVDMVMQRFIEVLSGMPNMVIVTLLVLILKPGIMSITIALLIKGWIGMSRVVRAQVLKLKEQEFILASRTLGTSNRRIIFNEVLPNILGQVIIMSMFSIPNAIFMESFLAFIGLGLQAPLASLGVLISDGFKSFLVYPFMVAIPTIVLAVLMLSFTVMADGLRDAFDPKMKEM
jgi:oligopeptide transport system permease protein